MTPSSRRGAAYAVGAFSMWGLMPLYLRQVAQVPAWEMVLHRTVWSLLFVGGVLALLHRWSWVREVLASPPLQRRVALCAVLLAVNWLTYVVAVQRGQVTEASLGYFINPLVNVVLGVTVLRERLSRLQWMAVALAAAGVVWITVDAGALPWASLVLALTFGFYGLLRKTSPLGPMEGLAAETALVAPFAVAGLAWWTWHDGGVLASGDVGLLAWLLLAGPLSVVPLVLFAAGARRLPLALVGLVQYLSPTLQLLLAVFVFHEPFGLGRLVGFLFIWAALALVSLDAVGRLQGRAAAARPEPSA